MSYLIHGKKFVKEEHFSKFSVKSGMKAKFTANYDTVEECMKSATVGLVTLDEMREKQKDVSEMRYYFSLNKSHHYWLGWFVWLQKFLSLSTPGHY